MREKWKSVADWRFEMLPARSTRMKTKGTPRAPGPSGVESRWQAVSNPRPKRRPEQVDVAALRLGGGEEGAAGQDRRPGEIGGHPDPRARGLTPPPDARSPRPVPERQSG